MSTEQHKIGLALSGGGTRGFAHLGALKALKEYKITVDRIAGTSAGAIVGLFYASGMEPEDIHKLLKSQNVYSFTRLRFPKQGFFTLEGLSKLIQEHIHVQNLEELPLPLTVTTTNMSLGKVAYFSEGSIIDTVIASASIPVIFTPVQLGGYEHCDGGIYDNLPAYHLSQVCEKVIGVNISPIEEMSGNLGLLDIASRSFQLGVNANVVNSIDFCDLYIEPKDIRKYGLLDSTFADEIFLAGYDSTRALLDSQLKTFEEPEKWLPKMLWKLKKNMLSN